MLAIEDVVVRFDGVTVLDHVSLTVETGQIVALLGPSGSGKSTLLRVVAGLLQPDAGEVWLDGVNVSTVATHRRNVGMVFQDEQLFPHLTVAGNIGFGLRMQGVSRSVIREQVAELLQLVGLSEFADRPVTRLSGGEAKRVALARSIAPRPSVLLLDEPLTGLDRDLHDELTSELAELLRSTSTTALLVTHDRDEAAAIAHHTVLLADLSERPTP